MLKCQMRGPSTQTLYNLKSWFSGFVGPWYMGTNWKPKKKEIGISFSLWDANGDKFVILASLSPRDLENRIPVWKTIHLDGANVSECRKYDSLTFCEIIFGGPFGGLRFQVSALRSHVSGVRSQKLMLSLTRFASFLTDAIAYKIFHFFDWCYRLPDFHFFQWCYRLPDLPVL